MIIVIKKFLIMYHTVIFNRIIRFLIAIKWDENNLAQTPNNRNNQDECLL